MSYEEAKIWIDVAQFVLTGAIGVYIHVVKKSDATNKRVDRIEKDHGNRLSKVEAAMPHVPTHNDMTQLHSDVAALKAETSGQTDLLKRLTAQVDLINQWLVNRAK